MSDYMELPLYLEGDDESTLYAHLKDKSLLVFHNVRNDPIRYEGWWVIDHFWISERVNSHILASDVLYFTTRDATKVTENVTLGDKNAAY